MIKINLVPAEILAKARRRQLVLQTSAAGGVLLVLMAAASLAHWAGLRRLQGEYAAKQAKLKQLSAVVAQVDEIGRQATAVRARLGVISSLLKGRFLYPVFLSEFARTVPSGVLLTQLSTSSQPDGGLKLAISAKAGGNRDIAAWLRALQADPHFSGVELGPVNASGTDGAQQYSFTLSAAYAIRL